MKVVAIHQPEYFPLLGYLDKAKRADVFVLLDHVQFSRDKLEHRARVVGPGSGAWMTIPFVHRHPQRIVDVVIADDGRWRKKHLATLQTCYGRAPAWTEVFPQINTYFCGETTSLADATIASVALLFDAFGITTPVVRSSSSFQPFRDRKSDLVLDICRRLEATHYLSGRGGSTYLDREAFARAGIEIIVQDFTPPEYPRFRPLPEEEVRRVSALDAWVHMGRDAAALLSPQGRCADAV